MATSDGPERDPFLTQVKLEPVKESREMVWRNYTKDDFLDKLFLLEGTKFGRTLSRGERLTLVADVYRSSTISEAGQHHADVDPEDKAQWPSEGSSRVLTEFVCKMRGILEVGVWGTLTLPCAAHEDGLAAGPGDDRDAEDMPSLTLELRPRSMRPFSLEYCRPDCPTLAAAEDCFGRKHRDSVCSVLTEEEVDRKSREDSSIAKQNSSSFRFGSGMRSSSYLARDSVVEDAGFHASTSAPSPTVIHASSSSRRRPSITSYGSGNAELQLHPVASSSQKTSKRKSFMERAFGDSLSAGVGGNVGARLRKLVNRRIKNARSSRISDVPREYVGWLPPDWRACWKSPWSSHTVDKDGRLREGLDIVPLMEAEFRRDCIIFFNTLFPRTGGRMFAELRDLCFEPGSSKLGFKLMMDKTNNAKVSHTLGDFSVGLAMDEDLVGDATKRATSSWHHAGGRNSTGRGSTGATRSWRTWRVLGSKLGKKDIGFGDEGDMLQLGILSDSDEELEPDCTATPANTSSTAAFRESMRKTFSTRGSLSPKRNPMGNTSLFTLPTARGYLMDEYSPRIMVLKRLFLCFAACGVYYTEVSKSEQSGELWPYPLASVLGHGSRVLIRLEDVEGHELLNFLLLGDPHAADWKDGIPYPLTRRLAATHAVMIENGTGNLVEKRLQVTSASATVQNISDGIRRKHLGLDVPIGGMGNPSPLGSSHFIDFAGRVLQRCEDKGVAAQASVNSPASAQATPPNGATSPTSSMNVPGPREPGLPPWFQSCGDDQESACGSPGRRQGSPCNSTELGDTTGRLSLGLAGNSMSSFMLRQPAGQNLRLVQGVQGGHMYIRMDDFGERTSRSSMSSWREEARRWLCTQPRDYILPLEQAKLRARSEAQYHRAGELFFVAHVPHLRARRATGVSAVDKLEQKSGQRVLLLRMNSEPSLMHRETDASGEDVRWAKESIISVSQLVLRPPPSPEALRLFLEHYDAVNTQLYGVAGFKSIRDLFHELVNQRSFLTKHGFSVQRYVEPVILQLRWNGHILMLTHEVFQGADGVEHRVPKNTFMSASMAPDESWKQVLFKKIEEEFRMQPKHFMSMLKQSAWKDDVCHRLVEEDMASPSYPGLVSTYRAHMVVWEIREDRTDFPGLPADRTPRRRPNRCDFTTEVRDARKKTRCWRWVPEHDAQKAQRFLNMGVKTADEKWARYAFQKEGVVQYPPSLAALGMLLSRCGVDLKQFGKGGLEQFWLELLNQQGYLQMSMGHPLRITEALFVRLRWKRGTSWWPRQSRTSTGDGTWHVLVKEEPCSSVRPGGTDRETTSRVLLNTLKYREEFWEESALRCLREELCLTKGQVKCMLDARAEDSGARYAFHEAMANSTAYPGIQTLNKLHGVTFTLRDDIETLADWQDLFQVMPHPPGIGPLHRGDSKSSAGQGAALEASTASRQLRQPEAKPPPDPAGAAPGPKAKLEWMAEEDAGQVVQGMSIWAKAKECGERHRISSVLIGLEGSAPHARSPFGVVHDASGKSGNVSALGGSKWRTLRMNNASQIPCDCDGMHVKLTRQKFTDLMETCDQIGLVEASLDLLNTREMSYSREVLNHRFREKELFKQILAGNGKQAKQTLEWMKEHASARKMPAQAYAAMHRWGRRSCRDEASRAAPVPKAGPGGAAFGRVFLEANESDLIQV